MADNYNEGHSGYTINQINTVMGPALQMRPNVILLHAGTNDLNKVAPIDPVASAPDRLGALIDNVLTVCPDAVLLVAKLINAADSASEANIQTYNEVVPGVVQERFNKGYKIATVDQSVVQASELIDGVHP